MRGSSATRDELRLVTPWNKKIRHMAFRWFAVIPSGGSRCRPVTAVALWLPSRSTSLAADEKRQRRRPRPPPPRLHSPSSLPPPSPLPPASPLLPLALSWLLFRPPRHPHQRLRAARAPRLCPWPSGSSCWPPWVATVGGVPPAAASSPPSPSAQHIPPPPPHRVVGCWLVNATTGGRTRQLCNGDATPAGARRAAPSVPSGRGFRRCGAPAVLATRCVNNGGAVGVRVAGRAGGAAAAGGASRRLPPAVGGGARAGRRRHHRCGGHHARRADARQRRAGP